jgi:diaminopimelate epimerase
MSVPHTMIFVDKLEATDVCGIGRQIETDRRFPQGTNVNFVQVLNRREIAVSTWERGAGATLACGTGSCASVVASILNQKTEKHVIVHLALGDLSIEWGTDKHVLMSGPAENVFRGQIDI